MRQGKSGRKSGSVFVRNVFGPAIGRTLYPRVRYGRCSLSPLVCSDKLHTIFSQFRTRSSSFSDFGRVMGDSSVTL